MTTSESVTKTPEALYAKHKDLAAKLEPYGDILAPVAAARKRLGEIAAGSLIQRIQGHNESKALKIMLRNHEQALASGYQALDPRDVLVAQADAAQRAYDANLQESQQHFADHPDQYELPKEQTALTETTDHNQED